MYTFRCCNKHSEEVGTRDVHIIRQSWTGLNKLSENIQPDSMERAGIEFCELMPITSKSTDKAAS